MRLFRMLCLIGLAAPAVGFMLSVASCGSPTCSPASCLDGCCGPDGICYVDGADTKCGFSGVACVDCTQLGQVCQDSSSCAARTAGTGSGTGTGTGSGGTASGGCGGLGASCILSSDCCGTLGCNASATCTQCAANELGCTYDSDCCSDFCDSDTNTCL
jgi:hypothetical protein